jgi:RNA polymerase sigma-70 factor (ECF subfamily)
VCYLVETGDGNAPRKGGTMTTSAGPGGGAPDPGLSAVIGLLDLGATAIGDGGGPVAAGLRPVEGGEQVALASVEVARMAPGLTLLERTVNGQPGLVAQLDGVTVTVLAFDVADGKIKHIWAVRNPEKLRPWTTG